MAVDFVATYVRLRLSMWVSTLLWLWMCNSQLLPTTSACLSLFICVQFIALDNYASTFSSPFCHLHLIRCHRWHLRYWEVFTRLTHSCVKSWCIYFILLSLRVVMNVMVIIFFPGVMTIFSLTELLYTLFIGAFCSDFICWW